MARRLRVAPIGFPQHVIQRGNNRHVCFGSEDDRRRYLHWLGEYARRYEVDVHAWVLMSNHVHLLCTPRTANAVSTMMQSLGRRYVRMFNHRYQRTGTLWEGRYKSCLVESESYMLALYRYIELNPVRAGMVATPGDYPWSSFRRNAWGEENALCTSHALYLSLGRTKAERMNRYRALFDLHMEESLVAEIRSRLNSGIILGNARFARQIEALTGRKATPARIGRPRNPEAVLCPHFLPKSVL